jgi:hypothetical protein
MAADLTFQSSLTMSGHLYEGGKFDPLPGMYLEYRAQYWPS